MTAKDILSIIPIVQSTALAGENIKSMKKKKKKSEDFIDMGIKNVIGTEFIKIQAQAIGDFP
jgi:hypothetical protein